MVKRKTRKDLKLSIPLMLPFTQTIPRQERRKRRKRRRGEGVVQVGQDNIVAAGVVKVVELAEAVAAAKVVIVPQENLCTSESFSLLNICK